jgi:ABC-type lipoprotein export system ATPase subunit
MHVAVTKRRQAIYAAAATRGTSMSENPIEGSATPSKGAARSVIESFSIDGLHGYRSVSFASKHAATILIARNGSGKTTLLGAMDAFLKKQFYRLSEVQFTEIRCKLSGTEPELVLSREDLDEVLSPPADQDLARLSQRLEIPSREIFQFAVGEWNSIGKTPNFDNRIYTSVLRNFDYNREKASGFFEDLVSRLVGRNSRLMSVLVKLDTILAKYEIVYLPTYRRIELALQPEDDDRRYGRRRPRFNVAAGSLFTSDIQFGLGDISDRLKELNSQIVGQSNSGYMQLSATVINDLLDGGFEERLEGTRPTPSSDDLRLFFARLEASRHYGPYFHVRMPSLQKLNDARIAAPASSKFLNYFLNQLGTVINATKDIERSVENFVDSCNKYLMADEISTARLDSGENARRTTVDGKRLKLNRNDLSVSVESTPDSRQIPLDALSSGEKQMISLFAKLYLYEKPKLVLIDEPELSLSIEWQRSILVDVLNAPLCQQIVAITHSPFVFENELEAFARSLQNRVMPSEPQPQVRSS